MVKVENVLRHERKKADGILILLFVSPKAVSLCRNICTPPILNNMEFSNYKITIRVDILHDWTGVSHKAVKISADESM